jgi:HlyD family secretion protein
MPHIGRQFEFLAGLRKAALAGMSIVVLALGFILWLKLSHPPQIHGSGGAAGSAAGSGDAPGSAPSPDNRAGQGVGCLGYIEPKDGVLAVSAPYVEGRPQRVLALKVGEGDKVRVGQLLAILDGQEALTSAVRLADERVNLAQSRLTQVKAGASESDIAAQKEIVSQLKDALANARAEYNRFAALRKGTDVSEAELDTRRLAVDTAERREHEAEERLLSLTQVRPTEVDVAQSELDVAKAEAASARVNLKLATVYAPTAGRVLKIHAHPGEETGPQGLLDLGKTDAMYVEAEVYESDIARVHAGQRAVITSSLFSGSLSGAVETVGTMISKADILPLDPVAFADARVFKVWIRLDDGARASGLIHGKVNVVIKP